MGSCLKDSQALDRHDFHSLDSTIIGYGQFSFVKKIHKDGRIFACKISPKNNASKTDCTALIRRKTITYDKQSKEVMNMYRNEISILKYLKDCKPGDRDIHLLELIDSFEDEKYVYFITPFFEGGELFSILTKKQACDQLSNEKTIITIALEILFNLHFFHTNNVIHRDLKLENILLRGKNINEGLVIIDFGLSLLIKDDHSLDSDNFKSLVGSRHYLAPELIEKKPQYSYKSDIWSMGVIIYLLLYKKYPFDSFKKDSELEDKILRAEPDYISDNLPSIKSIKFLKKLLAKDVNKRYDTKEALRDEWFLDNAYLLPMNMQQQLVRLNDIK